MMDTWKFTVGITASAVVLIVVAYAVMPERKPKPSNITILSSGASFDCRDTRQQYFAGRSTWICHLADGSRIEIPPAEAIRVQYLGDGPP